MSFPYLCIFPLQVLFPQIISSLIIGQQIVPAHQCVSLIPHMSVSHSLRLCVCAQYILS